jgi:hypothetical protein
MPSHVMSFSHNFPFSLCIVAWVIPKARHARCVRYLFNMEELLTIISVQHIFIPYDINYSIYTRDSPWSVSLTWLYIVCFNPVISLICCVFMYFASVFDIFAVTYPLFACACVGGGGVCSIAFTGWNVKMFKKSLF